jgi:hypothetical protein
MIQETRLQDMPRTETSGIHRETIDIRTGGFRRISWGAIVAGVFSAIAVEMMLMILGAAIGLSVAAATGPGSNSDATGISVGAGIWMLLSGIIGLFAGGWIAARLSGTRNDLDALLHGFLTWGTGTVVSLVLLTSAGMAVLGGTLNAASNVAGPVVSRQTDPNISNRANLSGSSERDVDQFIRQRLDSLPSVDVDGSGSELISSLRMSIQAANPTATQTQNAADALASHANMNRTEAQQTIDRWRQEFRAQSNGSTDLGANSSSAQQTVRNAADKATRAAAGVSWWSFFALLLGAAAACVGGYVGAPRDEDVFSYGSR